MRFTSSRRSRLALLLCVILALPPSAFAEETGAAEPAMLLRYAAPELSDAEARRILDPLPGLLSAEMRVRFLPAPGNTSHVESPSPPKPFPDDAALRRISLRMGRIAERMESVETAEAERLLEEAERDCRSYRFTDAILPFLGEIFLRKGVLRIWQGRRGEAEALLGRVLALRSDFSPDPALFPPQFLSAWESSKRRPVPEIELLVESIPTGAEVDLDGVRKGVTPLRLRTRRTDAVRIRVAHPGYRVAETEGQWLPGDTEILRFTLEGDPVARLGELLGGGVPLGGTGSGPLADAIASAFGARRFAAVTIGNGGTGGTLHARLYGQGGGNPEAVLIGETVVAAGKRGAQDLSKWIAASLAAQGWPRKELSARPWYYNGWFWGVLLSAAAVAVVIGGTGGGGSGGASSGSVAVNF